MARETYTGRIRRLMMERGEHPSAVRIRAEDARHRAAASGASTLPPFHVMAENLAVRPGTPLAMGRDGRLVPCDPGDPAEIGRAAPPYVMRQGEPIAPGDLASVGRDGAAVPWGPEVFPGFGLALIGEATDDPPRPGS